jgi:hypothetical protein
MWGFVANTDYEWSRFLSSRLDLDGFTGEIVMATGGWKRRRMMRRNASAAVTVQTFCPAAEAVSGHELIPAPKRSGTCWWQSPREYPPEVEMV